VDTTLGYVRLYDGTIVAHYYRAMGEVEERLESERGSRAPPFIEGQWLALVDGLGAGTLELAW
jgi:hypothetical protein